MKRHLASAILLGMALLAPTAVLGQPQYFPLVQGYEWSYLGSGSISIDRTVDGEKQVDAALTSVMRNVQVGPISETWENYWTSDAEGRLLLHGFFNFGANFGIRYDPPILWIDASPQTSDTWSTTTTAYDLDDGTEAGVLTVGFEAFVPVEITVPAGTFDTLMLDYTTLSGAALRGNAGERAESRLASYSLLGQRLDPRDDVSLADDQLWYGDGIGLVRESSCCPLQTNELATFKVVSTAEESWGRLKSNFGD